MADDDLTESTTTHKRQRITTDTFAEREEGGNVESSVHSDEENEPEHSDEDAHCKEKARVVRPVDPLLTDMNVLKCPVCLEFLTAPVFQCDQGHIACNCCCLKMNSKCPSCSLPIGYIRCTAIEKVVESVVISCPYVQYGCDVSKPCSEIRAHKTVCIYAPCSCPFENCSFVCSTWDLRAHFGEEHLSSAKCFSFDTPLPINLEKTERCVILREQKEGTIFVLNHRLESRGSAVNIIQISPPSAKVCRYFYKIISRAGGSSYQIRSFAQGVSKWSADLPLEGCLLVPIHLTGSHRISLEVCFKKPWWLPLILSIHA